MADQALLLDVPAHLGNEDDNQRYTTRRALAWIAKTTGVERFDLDVAACAESHKAPTWYGWDRNEGRGALSLRDGLALPWFGEVFCNPPWDNIEPWVAKAWASFTQGPHQGYPFGVEHVCMLLPGNRTHRPWWQNLVEPLRDGRNDKTGYGAPVVLDVHFAPERFAYGGPGNPEAVGVSEPNFTSVLLHFFRT